MGNKALRSSTQYFRLLISANPGANDLLLLAGGVVAALGAGVPFPIIAILFGELVDNLNTATCSTQVAVASDLQSQINDKLLKVVYLGIANFGTIYIYTVCWNLFGERLAQRLREAYLRALLRQDAAFFDDLPAGEVASRLSNDISTIQRGTSEKTGIFLASISFFITSYVVAFTRSARLAGILVSLFPAYLLMALVGGFFVEKFATIMSAHVALATATASEALSSIPVIHAFGVSDKLEAQFAEHAAAGRMSGLKKAAAAAIQTGMLYFIAYSANGLAFWQGSRDIARSVESPGTGITVGVTYTVIFMLVDASLILAQHAPFIQFFNSAAGAFDKLELDMARTSKIDGVNEMHGTMLSNINGDIVLDNVSFSYPSRPGVTVLDHVSLNCPAGRHTAIVGLSGSGKSTIAGLVTRLYDPTEGRLLLDGSDLSSLNVRSLRSNISLVQQEPSLLDRSILENIAHGLVNSTSYEAFKDLLLGSALSEVAAAVRGGENLKTAAEAYGPDMIKLVGLVENAASLADVSTFVSTLKNGYGTLVGSKGTLVSAGQEQRISIARALVKDPKILVLDEATASLDSSTEMRIQSALEKFAVGRTLITIAHRLSTIRNADKIIVMGNGKILEHGTHVELLAQNGHYARLSQLQGQGRSEAGDGLDAASNEEEVLVRHASSSSAIGTSTKSLDEKAVFAEVIQSPRPSSLTQEDELSTKRTKRSLSRILSPLFRPYVMVILSGFVGSLIIGGAYSGSAVIFGNTIGDLSPCRTPAEIRSSGSFWGLMFFVLAIIELAANTVSFSAFGYLTEGILYKVRLLSLRALLKQDLHWHESHDRSPSTLLSFITDDCGTLSGITGSVLGMLVSIMVNMLAAIILTLIVAWKIALVCLAVVPVILGIGYAQLVTLSRFAVSHQQAFAKSIGITTEAVNSIKTVSALSLEHEVLSTYRRSLKKPNMEMTKKSATANLWLAAAYGMPNFLYALAYWWGSTRIIAGEYNQTQFFIVVVALLVSAQLWGQMFALAPDVVRARTSINRVVNLLQLNPLDKDIQSAKERLTSQTGQDDHDEEKSIGAGTVLDLNQGGIPVKVDSIYFAYPARPDVQVLRGLTLDLKPGQFGAVVGPSGAGKTTILSMIERMYRPSSGAILIDNHNILAQDGTSFRDDIAYVPKDAMLFQGTIAFNVSLGARPNRPCTQRDIEEACMLANIHEVIMSLPEGYETQCGANGNRLSGGQKQRLSIARALVRKPRLLLLDESTSALDAESERLLQDGIDKIAKHTTILSVAHRLHTIKKADVIFLIEEGQCVDRGTHSELFERSESYRINAVHQALDA